MLPRVLQVGRRAPGAGAWHVLCNWTILVGCVHIWLRLCYRVRFRGQSNIPSSGAFLLLSNHQSHLDPMVVGIMTRDRPNRALARSTLFDSRLLGFLMRLFGTITLRQGQSDTAAIRTAVGTLKSGRVVLVFPEGRRSEDGRIAPFERGTWLLLKRAKVPVLPAALDGAIDAWPVGQRPSLRGIIESEVGAPIAAADLLAMGEEQGLAFLRKRIEELRRGCRDRVDARSGKQGRG